MKNTQIWYEIIANDMLYNNNGNKTEGDQWMSKKIFIEVNRKNYIKEDLEINFGIFQPQSNSFGQ